jgi:hypothetical protein
MSGQTGNINYGMDAFDQFADRLTEDQAAELMAMFDRIQASIERNRNKNSKAGGGRSGKGTKDRDSRLN